MEAKLDVRVVPWYLRFEYVGIKIFNDVCLLARNFKLCQCDHVLIQLIRPSFIYLSIYYLRALASTISTQEISTQRFSFFEVVLVLSSSSPDRFFPATGSVSRCLGGGDLARLEPLFGTSLVSSLNLILLSLVDISVVVEV